LKACCLKKQDLPLLCADLAGKDWSAIIAYEIRYHRSCYRAYTRLSKNITEIEETCESTIDYVREKVIESHEIVTKEEILTTYNNSLLIGRQPFTDARPLLEKIADHFGKEISVWRPKYGKQFLYKTCLTKEEIIEYYMRKMEDAEKEIQELKKEPNQKDLVKDVAIMIRNEIKKSPATYGNWPPTAAQLLQSKTDLNETVI